MKVKLPPLVQKCFSERSEIIALDTYELVQGNIVTLPIYLPIAQLIRKGNFTGTLHNLIKKQGDWDLTTEATPEQMLAMFPDAFYKNKFGTVSVPIKDNIIEVTTFRSEEGYSDKRRPDKVTWGTSLEKDLERRDFTVNAIAIKL